jgi:hypothetical protein
MSPLPRAPGSGSSRLAAGSPLLVVMFRARGRRAPVGGSGSKREPWSAGHGTPLWPPPRRCAVVAAAAAPLWSGGHSDPPLRYADVAAAVPGPLRRCGHRYAAGHTQWRPSGCCCRVSADGPCGIVFICKDPDGPEKLESGENRGGRFLFEEGFRCMRLGMDLIGQLISTDARAVSTDSSSGRAWPD